MEQVTRRTFLEASAALAAVPLLPAAGVFQATGFKVCVQTSTNAVVQPPATAFTDSRRA